jgi:hypothetical protein
VKLKLNLVRGFIQNEAENEGERERAFQWMMVSSPCLWASFHPQAPLSTSNQWYLQSKEILLNLGMNAETQHLMHKVGE